MIAYALLIPWKAPQSDSTPSAKAVPGKIDPRRAPFRRKLSSPWALREREPARFRIHRV